MGNANSNEKEISNSKDDPGPGAQDDCVLGLSPVEIHQIRQLWAQARRKGPNEPGKSILMVIFMKNPEIERNLFRFSDKNEIHKKSELFTAHAQRFTRALDHVIKNLNDKKLVDETLTNLGKKHVMARAEGFQVKYWQTFTEAMIDETLKWGTKSQRNQKTQEAWTKIVFYLIEKMRDGYYQELKRTRPSVGNLGTKSPEPNFFKEA